MDRSPRCRLLGALLLACAVATPVLAQAEGPGSLRGTVFDKDFDVPLARARVTLVGTVFTAFTGPDGTFVVERISSGTYTVVVSKDGYERQVISGVAVAPGRLTEVRADLSAEIVEMEELVVTGDDLLADRETGLLEIRASAVTLQDSISAELIGKAGASDAAGALKLVVGASVVGGKYATVRGLSDRYTGTTLNGVRVPSPDPRRRAVQVDLFPTGTIESVTVDKTFTPNLQGDFTGGGIDIRTKSIPESRLLKITLSGEYDSEATGNDAFLTYEGGGVGAFGISGDGRDLPRIAKIRPPRPPTAKIFTGTGARPVTEQETADALTLDAFTRAFDPVMGVSRGDAGPGSGVSIVGGNRTDLSESSVLGWTGAWTYSRKFDFYENGVNNAVGVSEASQPAALTRNFEDSRGTEEVLMGALASVQWQSGDRNDLTFRVVADHGAEDEARYQIQRGDVLEQNQALQYTERTLVSPQLQGRHAFARAGGRPAGRLVFGDTTLDWRVSANYTRQFEPDVRFFSNLFDPNALVGYRTNGTNDLDRWRRIWRDIKERNQQVAIDLTFPFKTRGGTDGRLRAGTYVERVQRAYTQRSFSYAFANQTRPRQTSDLPAYGENVGYGASFDVARDCAGGACGPDLLWTDVFLQSKRIGLAGNLETIANQLLWYAFPLGSDVDYDGGQSIDAAYLMAEIPIHRKLRLVGGARWERTEISIDPSNAFDGRVRVIRKGAGGNRSLAAVPAAEARVTINQGRWMPALSAAWEIVPQMNVRASWSRTIARPTFRELAPVATEEFLLGDSFIGNSDLRLSTIRNVDLRWEWFRRPGDVLAASVFSKRLRDPIEYISFGVAGIGYVQPVNYERGSVQGYELEARTGLDVIWSKLAGIAVGANFTHLSSDVVVPRDERESLAAFALDVPSRRLQGQPASILNVNATYDNERTGTSAGIFYNVVGTSLLTGAARGNVDGTPDVFEDASSSLDVTFSQKLGKGLALGLKARNLLEDGKRTFFLRPNGETVTKSERSNGVVVGASLSWTW